ncbi:MAG TPA: four helix bundle protein [Candidatus Acidoferrales bacterium]|nr:four helix bundle protein [Candidatus Acidoferrales bacterium]
MEQSSTKSNPGTDRLKSFGIYQLAWQLFEDFWNDSEVLVKDFRGRELAKQQVRSLDSICANIEEGFGRGFGKELPQHLKIARGEARESQGRFKRCNRLHPSETITNRVATLDHIIGGLTKTISTIEGRQKSTRNALNPVSRHPSPVTRHHKCF